MWHLTRDTRHVTPDMWHMICDMWHIVEGENSLKILAPQFLQFGIDSVLKILNKRMNEWIDKWINDKGIYRTAPATPGLSKRSMVEIRQEISLSSLKTKWTFPETFNMSCKFYTILSKSVEMPVLKEKLVFDHDPASIGLHRVCINKLVINIVINVWFICWVILAEPSTTALPACPARPCCCRGAAATSQVWPGHTVQRSAVQCSAYFPSCG